jgi:hypothetical protein
MCGESTYDGSGYGIVCVGGCAWVVLIEQGVDCRQSHPLHGCVHRECRQLSKLSAAPMLPHHNQHNQQCESGGQPSPPPTIPTS